mgnify:CR=1 FL=1
MPAYRFEALDPQGRTHQDLIEADSERAARQQLRARQWVPLSVVAVSTRRDEAGARTLLRARVFTPTARTVWTRQLAGLLVAGLPLERALTALMDEAPERRQQELLAQLRSEVNAGAPFALALSRAPREFDEVYRAVVAAGEQTGALGQVLERLADDLEAQQQLRAKLMGAALYPAIVSLVALAIVVFLLTSVVPQVAGVFAGSQRQLPWLTSAMLALSAAVRQWGWLMLLLAAGASLALRIAMRQPTLRLRWDAAWLRLPVIGRLARGYNAARFASTLAMLSAAGVPILKGLQAAADTLSNQALRADVLDALVQVREGAPLAMALARQRRFSGLLPMFARLGEQTGQLPQMLQRASQQLAAEVQRRAMALATVLEPLLIVAMGGLVMVIVLAVLMPIMEMNQWVR